MIRLKTHPDLILPPANIIAEAGGRGVSNLVIAHLRQRNASLAPDSGFRKTDYYADAADSVTTAMNGKTAVVSIEKEGVALHYEGGTVYPKKKALAVPVSPAVQGIWPSERGGDMSLVWIKGKTSGTLRDKESGEILYRLLPRATIPSDPTVLPVDTEMLSAAENAVMMALDAWEVAG